MSEFNESLYRGAHGRFERTRWSLVRRAALRSTGENDDLEVFCRIYWYPLYAAARRSGQCPQDASDSVQVLFARLIERNSLSQANPESGRLRSWLLTMLQNQSRDRLRAQRAQKRGGGVIPFSLDADSAEATLQSDPAMHDDPMVLWRRNLAASLLDESLEALEAAYRKSGKAELFSALMPALEGPLPESTYEQTAERLGTTGGALRMAVVRLRDRFRATLRAKAAVALGVPDGPELERELRDLLAAP
jgi:RNA polymerase sigma factor (sigma-70 family)